MRVNKNVGGGGGKYGLTDIMKLVIAIVFTLTVALLNSTEPISHTATVKVSETASAVAPAKADEKPKAQTQETPAPTVKPFDPNDQSTWPTCAADEIVRADNGQCSKKPEPAPVQAPAPAVTQASPAPAGDVETIVRNAAIKYGVNPDYFVRIARCESTLNPNAVNYGYNENGYPSGLFQHLSGYWPSRAAKYGWAGASVFNAQANAEVTAQMFRDGMQHLWECN